MSLLALNLQADRIRRRDSTEAHTKRIIFAHALLWMHQPIMQSIERGRVSNSQALDARQSSNTTGAKPKSNLRSPLLMHYEESRKGRGLNLDLRAVFRKQDESRLMTDHRFKPHEQIIRADAMPPSQQVFSLLQSPPAPPPPRQSPINSNFRTPFTARPPLPTENYGPRSHSRQLSRQPSMFEKKKPPICIILEQSVREASIILRKVSEYLALEGVVSLIQLVALVLLRQRKPFDISILFTYIIDDKITAVVSASLGPQPPRYHRAQLAGRKDRVCLPAALSTRQPDCLPAER